MITDNRILHFEVRRLRLFIHEIEIWDSNLFILVAMFSGSGVIEDSRFSKRHILLK